MKAPSQFNDEGGLLAFEWQGKAHCLGYLLVHEGRVFDATHGAVNVTPEQAQRHNAVLDEATLKGLDEGCEVGMGGTFYLKDKPGEPSTVRTWLGALVTDDIVIHGSTITFRRGGKVYRGRLQRDADCFNFRRIK